jgi:hypothetical protein
MIYITLSKFLIISSSIINKTLLLQSEKSNLFEHFPQGSISSHHFGAPAGSNINKLYNAKGKNKQ